MKWLKCLLALCVLFVSQIVVASNSYATSSYDSVVKSGGSAVLSIDFTAAGGGCSLNNPHIYDLTAIWDDIVLDSSRYYNGAAVSPNKPNAIAAFQDAFDSGTGWALVQNFAPGDYTSPNGANSNLAQGDTWLTAMVSDDPTATLTTDSQGNELVMDGSWYALTIAYTNNIGTECNIGVTNIAHSTGVNYGYIQQEVNTNEKAVFINFDITYPTGYEGEILSAQMPSAKYVAMGDSYSSGEGNLPFEYGTDTEANICHRSQKAYPRLLQFDSSLSLGSTAFMACSGAVSNYIINDYNQENVELPQAVALSSETELVTISIGGNDIGFPATIRECVASTTAQSCLDALDTASDNISDPDFLSNINNLLTGIRSLSGVNTQVIAVGYPQLFPAYEDISGTCTWGEVPIWGVVSARTITEDEIVAIRQVHDDLNSVLQAAVADTLDTHVHFVDPTLLFDGHEVCGGLDDWMNGVVPLVSTSDIGVASFHPNIDGQVAYASIIKNEINNF